MGCITYFGTCYVPNVSISILFWGSDQHDIISQIRYFFFSEYTVIFGLSLSNIFVVVVLLLLLTDSF